MHVRLKLREPKGLVAPKGPNRLYTVNTEIAGSSLNFRVPRHRPWNPNAKAIFPDSNYPKGALHLYSRYNDQDEAKGRKEVFQSREIFAHAWAYYGPWFTGVLSELRLNIYLYRPINYSQQFSLFHPRAFEALIADYLGYLYSHHVIQSRSIQKFIAPVRWTPLNYLSVNAVKLEMEEQASIRGGIDRILVFFPLLDDLMVVMHFEASRLSNLLKAEIDKLVDPKPMHDMVDTIIQSIQLKLSPEAQAQQVKALEGLADTSLTKHFPPIKWDQSGEKSTQETLLEAGKNDN